MTATFYFWAHKQLPVEVLNEFEHVKNAIEQIKSRKNLRETPEQLFSMANRYVVTNDQEAERLKVDEPDLYWEFMVPGKGHPDPERYNLYAYRLTLPAG
jgi:hypothetical protein